MVSVATSRTTLIVPYDQRLIKKRTKKYAEPLQLLEATLNAKITAEDCSGTTHSAMREMEKQVSSDWKIKSELVGPLRGGMKRSSISKPRRSAASDVLPLLRVDL